jgi:hypothetical protein
MGAIGNGYGSEWHLLRHLGQHRACLNEAVSTATGATSVRWLDFPFDGKKPRLDREWQGLEFLPVDDPARAAWNDYWPQTGTQQNWDAIGRASIGGREEWLLVEAKAHLDELNSRCGAKEKGGLAQIRDALTGLKRALSIDEKCDWLNGYYQLANRLAVLNFLTENGVPARLVLIYFTGDTRDDRMTCPRNEVEWQDALSDQDQWLGLKRDHPLAKRIHKVFLPVLGSNAAGPIEA